MKTEAWRFRAALLMLVVLWGLMPYTAFAQRFDVGGDFAAGLPQNKFRDNIRREGYGFSGHFGWFVADTPLMLGAAVGFLNYGSESRWEPFSGTIPDVTVEVRTTNNILLLHGFARVQPQRGAVRPFVEGLWGFKYLFTRTSIRDDSYYEETIASSTNFDDLAGSWGIGTGVDIRLWEGRHRGHRRGAFDVSLSLGAKYLWGSKAEYLKEGSIVRDPDGGLTYFVLRSRTEMFTPQAGLRIRF